VDPHPQAPLGEAQRGRATGDAAADDRDVDAAVMRSVIALGDGVFEPERVQDVER
jgi:hypothetical protein